MANYQWGSFTRRINIAADIEAVYEMWTSSQGLEKWFLRTCEITVDRGAARIPVKAVIAGARYLWRWYGWPDEVKEEGIFLHANGIDKLKFTFGQVGAENMECTVKIFTEADETICEITQEHIPEDEKSKTYYHIGCLTGWNFYLTNLKSILEGGIDLRNKNEQLKNMINS